MPEELSFTERMLADRDKSFTERMLEERATPWETIVAGVEKAGELTRAGGPYDPLALGNWGKVWTTIARLSPGRENLAEWEEQTTKEQLLTGAQAAAWIGIVPSLAQMGVSSITGIRQALRYNKSLKRMFTALMEQAKKQPTAVTLSPKEYKVFPSMEVMARDFQRGGMEAVVNNVKQKLGGLDLVKKSALRVTIENLAKTHFKAIVPTASAGPQKAVEIGAYIVAELPKTFKPQVADTMVDQARKLIDDAVRQLGVFNDFTLPKRTTDIPAKLPPIKERFVGAIPPPEKLAEVPVMKPGVKKPLPIPAEEVIEPTPAPEFGAVTEHQLDTINSLRVDKKFSPRQMKDAARAFGDVEKVEDLNERTAAGLIAGMEAVSLRATGRPYIPPHKGELLPSHYFVKGRPAGVESIFLTTPRQMEWINATDIYEKVEGPYINYQHATHDMFRLFDEMKKDVRGVKGSEKRLFHYLNGTLPKDVALSPQETVVATKLRTILDDYADRLNLPPERRLENYLYHMFEGATQRALREKYPFIDAKNKDVPLTDAMKSSLGLNVPKEIFTPTLLHRFGKREGLVEDVWKAMRGVASVNERRIHLQPALEEVRPMIASYPETSRSYMNDWLAHAVLKQAPIADKLINASVLRYANFMEKATKGKVSFGANPAKTIGYNFARLGYGGAVAFNLAIVGKNLTQQMLIPPLLRNPVHYGQAFGDIFTTKGKYLLKQSKVLTERFPMEAFDPKDIGKWMQKGMAPYKFVDNINVSMAFLAGVRDAQAMGLSPEEVIKYGDRIAKISQYSYRPIDMPRFMWQGGGAGRVAGMLQSWPINYFTNYLPELAYGTFTGYDTAGNKLPIHARARLFEHIAIASLFIYGVYKYRRVDFRKTFGPGVMPTYLSPGLSLSLAIGQTAHGWITNDYKETKDGLYKLSNAVPMFIPAGLQVNKTIRAYQQLAEGIDRDWAGRWKRNVSREEAITGVFTYPAQRSDFYETQKKVWEFDDRMRNITAQLAGFEQRGASYGRIHRKQNELEKLGEQRERFAEKLAAIKEGYPTEDDREWIEAILHTWELWP